MKNSILSLITRIFILLMIVVSCKKDNNEPNIIDLNVQRIAEVLYTNNGIEEYKDQFDYVDGLLSSQYSFQYHENGGWEYSYKNEFEYGPDIFRELTYSWKDNSWVLSGEMEAIFSGDNLIELTTTLGPGMKRTFSYDQDKLLTQVYYDYEGGQWKEQRKEEYLYDEGNIYRENYYLYKEEGWALKGYMSLDYQDNLVSEINDYKLVDDEWKIYERFNYYYFDQQLVKIECYWTQFMTEPLSLYYSIDYQYNSKGNLEQDKYSNNGSLSETFFTYEGGTGNHLQTLGAISKALNFPIDWPRPLK